jgi:hypothetical protein
MSESNNTFIKKNWLTFSNIIVLLSFIVYQAKWQQKVDSEMREMQRSLIEHHADKDQHLPFKDKIELFVPRTELEGRLMRIEKTLENIDKKLN